LRLSDENRYNDSVNPRKKTQEKLRKIRYFGCYYRTCHTTSSESMLSHTPVPLHGTQCPNTSVLNLTFVFLRHCWRHIFLTH